MRIKMLVMDVDGTLTDGCIYIGPEGEAMKAFNVQDGYAIARMLPENGIIPVIITGRCSKIVENRAAELKIEHIYQGTENKLEKLKEISEELGIKPEEIAYIGDDLNDLDCIRFCIYSGCPADAASDILKEVDYVCKRCGGKGAVREFAEKIILL